MSEGAEALKRDNPNSEVHFYDTGHLALETHIQQIACTMLDFLKRNIFSSQSQVTHSLFDNGKATRPSALE